jgi:serine/threonine protein kinase/Tol biopolymer transport system component
VTLGAGTRLGPYEIVAPLGAGGMGEVWRAMDRRLDRTVALKVLPEEFFEDGERRERFGREARLLASLNHPGIAAIFSFEEIPGPSLSSSSPSSSRHLLSMELVEGEDLGQRLLSGPLPVGEALSIARQIAEALEAAHEKGIVHRDLKPANVKVTEEGKVKLLDFGLAKALEEDPSREKGRAELAESPTLTAQATAAGVILGTAAYMSPEQARGKSIDKRTDIWAFGCVLYEMLTGKKAFSGETVSDTLAAILTKEPEWAALPAGTPEKVKEILRKCLRRDARARLHDIADARLDLEELATTASLASAGGAPAPGDPPLPFEERAAAPSPAVARSAPPSRERGGRKSLYLAWAVAAAAVVMAGLSVYLSNRPTAAEAQTRFEIMPPVGYGFFAMAKLSPDARRILFLLQDEGGRASIGVRSLDSLEIRRLPGTEGARGGFWSPDGREIAFFSEGRLKRIGAEGGPVQTVCESGGAFSGAWSRQGTILFTKEFGTPIVAVPATGGTPRAVTAIDAARGDVAHMHPDLLPDGEHFVFVARNLDPEKTSVLLASINSKEVRRLFHADSAAVYADPGYLLFARDNALFAQRFDPRSLKLSGEPAPLFEQVRYATEDNLLSVSAAGNRLVYLPWLLKRRLVWVDRKGRELGTLGATGGYEDVRISPDGRKVAVALRDPSHGENLDVWVLDTARGTGSRVTAERTDEFDPAWFPDGRRLVYVSDHVGGFYDLYERPVDGGAEKILLQTKQDKILPTVSPDGRHLLLDVSEGANYARVLVSLSGASESLRLGAGSRFSEEHPEMSPGGRWSAFDSNESGQSEVYVQPLPDGPKRQVSIGGGQRPIWNRNGSELFYAARDGMLMSVALRPASGGLEAAEPQPLFLLRLGVSGEIQFHRHPFDVSPDGQRFLVIRRAAGVEPDGVVVVSNWTALLKGSK